MRTRLAILGGDPAVDVPLPIEWPVYSQEALSVVKDLIARGAVYDSRAKSLIEGIEDQFKGTYGSQYALLTNSGTSSLLCAYYGCGIARGDEVLCPSYTYAATVTPLLSLGAIPVFCDAEDLHGNICPVDIEKKISAKTKAIVATHNWGLPVNLSKIVTLAKQRGLDLIEDCSHAHGAMYKGKRVGTFGRVGAFSIGMKKMVSGGMGGLLLTDDAEVFQRACVLGLHTRGSSLLSDDVYRSVAEVGLGFNLRIHPVAAALAQSHLSMLSDLLATKHENLARLTELLSHLPGLKLPEPAPKDTRRGWYGYKVHLDPEYWGDVSRQRAVEALRAEGLEVGVPKQSLLHRAQLFSNPTLVESKRLLYAPNKAQTQIHSSPRLANCDRIFETVIYLPAERLHAPAEVLVEKFAAAVEKVCVSRDLLA